MIYTAGPESLEDYFQKGALLGQKAGLNLLRQYQTKFAKTVPEHLKVCHMMIKFKKQTYV